MSRMLRASWLSVEHVQEKAQVVFYEDRSVIQNKTASKELEMRAENGPYFIDFWVEIPSGMKLNESFARHVRD